MGLQLTHDNIYVLILLSHTGSIYASEITFDNNLIFSQVHKQPYIYKGIGTFVESN